MSITKAHQRYRTKDGQICPGVTTIIDLLNKPFLVQWAWKLGMEGEDYRKVTQRAADIGTIAHHLIECYLKKQEPQDLNEYPLKAVQQAQATLGNFRDWWIKEKLHLIGSEIGIVSEQYRYGGTIDIVAMKEPPTELHKGEVWLLDIKTSKAVYDEYRIQLAAYKHAWEEVHPNQLIDSVHIVHLNKETGALGFHHLGDLTDDFQLFMHLRDIYELKGRKDSKRRTDYRTPYWYE